MNAVAVISMSESNLFSTASLKSCNALTKSAFVAVFAGTFCGGVMGVLGATSVGIGVADDCGDTGIQAVMHIITTVVIIISLDFLNN